MVRGLPGSGKSYLTAELQKALGKEDVLVLDPDSIDLTAKEYREFSDELAKEGLDKAIHPFRWSRKLACDAAVAGKVVIWNQPFTNRGIFERLVAFIQNYAQERGVSLPVLLVEVEIGHDTAKARIAERKQAGGHGPSDGTFAQRVTEYESYADGFNTVVVHGEDDVTESAAKVLEALQEPAQTANE
jgi:predicted kinase